MGDPGPCFGLETQFISLKTKTEFGPIFGGFWVRFWGSGFFHFGSATALRWSLPVVTLKIWCLRSSPIQNPQSLAENGGILGDFSGDLSIRRGVLGGFWGIFSIHVYLFAEIWGDFGAFITLKFGGILCVASTKHA